MPSFWKKDDPNKGRVLLAGFGNNTRWVDKDALRLVALSPRPLRPLTGAASTTTPGGAHTTAIAWAQPTAITLAS